MGGVNCRPCRQLLNAAMGKLLSVVLEGGL